MARLIDGDALIAWIKGGQQMTSKMKSIICYIKTMPTIDAVSVVRCKDCKWVCFCETENARRQIRDEKWYCADGERKESE